MKIIIVGSGKVGEYLFNDLNTDDNDIILIEKNLDVLNEMLSKYDIIAVNGNGASYNTLQKAEAYDADVFISVTQSDEINIISCIFAKKMGAKYTIARVRNPEYSEKYGFVKETLGIDLMINPEFVTAREISRSLKYPLAHSVETFADGRVKLVGISISKDSILNDLKISDLQKVFNYKILIGVVQRGEDIFIPSGNFVIKENDKVYFTGIDKYVYKFYNKLSLSNKNNKKIESVCIIGGGKVSYYLISNLLYENINIKLIEVNKEIAEFFNENFPNSVNIICADGSDCDVLEEEDLKNYDSCISLTGIDEENIMISMYAKKLGINKTIAKVNRLSLLNIISSSSDYYFVTPKKLVSDIIVSVVRSIKNSEGFNIETLHRICDNKVETAEIKIKKDSKVTNIYLKDLHLKENILIAYIIRNNKMIFPTGEDSMLVGDRVIIISRTNQIQSIDDILE